MPDPTATPRPGAIPPEHGQLCQAVADLLVSRRATAALAIGALVDVTGQLALSLPDDKRLAVAQLLADTAKVLLASSGDRSLQ